MNCQQVKKYIYAFLDSRTDLEKNLEIQEHIESCSNCTAELKIEDKIGRILSDLYIWETCPREVEDRMLSIIDNIESERHDKSVSIKIFGTAFRRSFGLKLLALAALILLFVSVLILMRPYTKITDLPIEIKGIASDNAYVASKDMALDIVSSDVQNIRRELAKQVQFSFVLPKFANYDSKAEGARVCLIGGKKGVHVIYRVGDNLVSYFAMPELNADLAYLKSFQIRGRTIYKAEYMGQRIFIWKQGAIYCALVSTISEDEMIKIVNSILEEGLA